MVAPNHNAPNRPRITLYAWRYPLFILPIWQKVQILPRFAHKTIPFEIQSCRKCQMHQPTSELYWTLSNQTYRGYTNKCLPPGPNSCPFLLCGKQFLRYKAAEIRKYAI